MIKTYNEAIDVDELDKMITELELRSEFTCSGAICGIKFDHTYVCVIDL